mgnify:CR=1 FL=1
MIYELNGRWAGRWRETWYDLGLGTLLVAPEATGELAAIDISNRRIAYLEADMIAFIGRDVPGILVKIDVSRSDIGVAQGDTATRQFDKPPADRQYKAGPTRRGRKKTDE